MSYPEKVITPNGPGYFIAQDQYGKLVIKHARREMTGTTKGERVTGDAEMGGIWAYEPKDVTFADGRPVVVNISPVGKGNRLEMSHVQG
jgi:hypothetical protein